MTIRTQTVRTIACDAPGCTKEYYSTNASLGELTDRATRDGWYISHPLEIQSELHYCPEHHSLGPKSKVISSVSDEELK